MRKALSLLLVFMLAFTVVAQATTRTATFGNQNSSNVYRLTADSDGVLTYAADTAIVPPYQNAATTTATANVPRQLVTADSGRTLVDWGGNTPGVAALSGSGSKYFLPPADTAEIGQVYSIVTGVKEFVTLDTYSSSDIILYSVSGASLSAGDSVLSSGNAGDIFTVQNTAANTWAVVGKNGTWTDAN